MAHTDRTEMKKLAFTLIAIAASLSASQAFAVEKIVDGSFEAQAGAITSFDDLGFESKLLTYTAASPWGSGTVNSTVLHNVSSGVLLSAYDGSWYANVRATGSVYQAFTLGDGKTYDISFAWASAGQGGWALQKSLGNDQFNTVTSGTFGSSAGNWATLATSYTVTSGTADYRLIFTAGAKSLAVDAVSVSAVPEPETYAMMLAGLGAVGFMARRRKSI